MKTNLMHCLSSVYFVNQPLHVSGIFVAHHQEVYCIYTAIGTCCAQHVPTVVYTGCPRRNGQNFGRVFLMLNYTDITQNTYIQS